MALPTKNKTWQFDVNQIIYGTTEEECIDNLFLALKNSLKNFVSSPWTVWGSSNSVSVNTGGGIDYWVNESNLVHSSAAHSWIVLESINGTQLCIDLNSTTKYNGSIIFSPGGLFTGGSTSSGPTASDQYTMVNSSNLYSSGVITSRLHILHSTDGYCTRIISYTNNQPRLFIICDVPHEPIPGWSNQVFTYKYNISSSLSYNLYNDNSNVYTRIGSTNLDLYCTSEGFVNAMIGENMIYADDDTGEWAMSPIGLVSTASPHRGRKGSLVDIWWGSTAISGGSTYPDDTSRQFVQFGDLIFPWNGSVPLTS